MIKIEDINDPALIQREICQKMEALPTHEMSPELFETYISVMLAKDIVVPENEKFFLFKVIEQRLKYCFSYKIEEHRLILLLCAVAETTGQAIMYLWYLQYWCYKNNVKVLTADIFSKQIFPLGFYAKEDLTKIWYDAKVKEKNSDRNLVDFASAGMSIQFTEVKETV